MIKSKKEPERPGIVIPETLTMPQKKIKNRLSFSVMGFTKLSNKPNVNPKKQKKITLFSHLSIFLKIRNIEARIIPKKHAITLVS